jgi:predicted DNA-binding protein (MmcQ/YjbR family)
MTYEELCAYLLKHPGAIKEHPLGADTLAFKVKDKVFALLDLQKSPMIITLKCGLKHRSQYQKQFPCSLPGMNTNDMQWISLPINNSLPLTEMLNIIDASYELVLKSLKKSVRDKLQREIP